MLYHRKVPLHLHYLKSFLLQLLSFDLWTLFLIPLRDNLKIGFILGTHSFQIIIIIFYGMVFPWFYFRTHFYVNWEFVFPRYLIRPGEYAPKKNWFVVNFYVTNTYVLSTYLSPGWKRYTPRVSRLIQRTHTCLIIYVSPGPWVGGFIRLLVDIYIKRHTHIYIMYK